MADYENLLDSIDAVIKANNRREITGQILQNTLHQMVGSLGENYQLAGFATPTTNPNSPDQNVFYITDEAGVYTNFDNITLGNGLSFLMWKNGQWSSKTMNIVTAEWVNTNYVSKAFLRNMFRFYDADGVEIFANDTESVVDNIKAMCGLWTEQYLSALGLSEGTTIPTTLAALNDVTITDPQDGQALVYDAESLHWVNATIQSGVDMSVVWAALAAATNEQINASHLSTALASYVTTTALNTTLASYVTTTALATALASYASESWVETNYVSKTFFNSLFQAQDASGNAITPNNANSTTIDRLKILIGAYTEQYLSALGLSAGGGGGSTTLAGLTDVTITNPQDGQALIYDAQSSHWVNGAAISMSAVWTALAAATNEQINSSHLTTALSGYVTTSALSTELASYVTSSSLTTTLADYVTSTALTTTLASYATQSWVDNAYVSKAFFNAIFQLEDAQGNAISPNADTTAKDRLKILVGAYTEQYLSALGLSAGGGGYTLNEPLASINSAALGTPSQANVAIVWNGTSWTYGTTASPYTLPTASASVLGGVKVGTTLAIDASGVLNQASGIATAGTYKSVTVDTYGRVTAGTNPTTLAGYGITDAYISNGTITLGSNTITPLTSETYTGTVTSVATGTGLTGGTITSSGTISIDSTYQTYISHGESAYNSLSNYLPLSGGTMTGVLTFYKYGRAIVFPQDYIGTNEDDDLYLFAGINKTINLLTNNSKRLTILNNGNVGIGTTSPSYLLSVNGDVSATNFRGALIGNADTATSAGSCSGNAATATTLQTSRSIWGQSFNGSADIPITAVAKMPYLLFKNYNDNNEAGYVGRGSSSNNTIRLAAYSGNGLAFETNGSNVAMTIDTSQQVGIGTTTPSYKLHVSGITYSSDNIRTGGYLCVNQNDGYGKGVSLYGTGTTTSALTEYAIFFGLVSIFGNSPNISEGWATYLTTNGYGWAFKDKINGIVNSIDSNGTMYMKSYIRGLGFYTSDTGQGNPSLGDLWKTDHTVGINIRGGKYGLFAWVLGSGNTCLQQGRCDGFTDVYHICMQPLGGRVSIGNTAPSYTLHVSGDIYATGGVTALSDARHKDIIRDTMLSVEQIAQMPSVVYRWNDGREDDGLHVGSIAQNWQSVLPEVVLTANDEEHTLSMQYGVAALVSSITIARKVVNHEERIKELEKECERLRTELEQLKVA